MSMDIQDRLESLQPHVMGMRFEQGVPLVDAQFADGWHFPPNNRIEVAKIPDRAHYFMFYSTEGNVAFDELLDYIENIIQLNM